jgi:hypothetical protein
MTIGSGIRVILSYYRNHLKGCSVGITDESRKVKKGKAMSVTVRGGT